MTAPSVPRASALPGIAHLKPTVDHSTGTAVFWDRNQTTRAITIVGGSDADGDWLTFTVDDGSFCSFQSCPSPNQAFWFATGLRVETHRCDIASNIYAVAQQVLARFGASITPSGNLFPDGVKLWGRLDRCPVPAASVARRLFRTRSSVRLGH